MLLGGEICNLQPLKCCEDERNIVHVWLWKHAYSRTDLVDMVKQIAPNLLLADLECLNDKRFQEKISTRLLLAQLLGEKGDAVAYYSTGRPYLKNALYEISMSHTDGVYAVSVACFRHGIDIEKWGTKAHRVEKMFVNDCERLQLLSKIPFETLEERATVVWSAKEAVYKMKDIEGLSLKHDIALGTNNNGNKLNVYLPKHSEKAFVTYKSYPECILTCCGAMPFEIK